MNPLIGLPKNANIRIGLWVLSIRDHEVVGNDMFEWIIGLVNDGHAQKMISILQLNSIKFDAVIEECIMELKKPELVIPWLVRWYWKLGNSHGTAAKFGKTKCAKDIAEMYINMLQNCKNYADLAEKTKPSTSLGLEVKNMADEGMKQCYH